RHRRRGPLPGAPEGGHPAARHQVFAGARDRRDGHPPDPGRQVFEHAGRGGAVPVRIGPARGACPGKRAEVAMYVSRPGARIFYPVPGSAEHDVVLVPPCYPIVYSRTWKMQVPYLSRMFRVATMDFRGNGRSDRPATGYDFETLYGDLSA